MIEELFNAPMSKSPRLLWMEVHGVTVAHDESKRQPFTAMMAGEPASAGYGETEVDALVDLAVKNNLKLWNQ
jgi:hypothetical protein